MNFFNARFDIIDAGYYDDTHYRIVGSIVDNTGVYFAENAQIGDIIYVDGSFLGVPLLRYKIAEINHDETMGAELSALVTWDMIEGNEPQEPFAGMEAIIGGLHSNGLTANITAKDYNVANELLIANANSYQAMLLGLNSGSDDGDGVGPGLAEVNNKINALEEKMKLVELEWEDKIKLSFE